MFNVIEKRFFQFDGIVLFLDLDKCFDFASYLFKLILVIGASTFYCCSSPFVFDFN